MANKQLDEHFIPVVTKADGNCLYNATSIAVNGSDNLQKIIRLALAAIFFKHESFFKNVIEKTSGSNGYTFDQIVNDSAKNHQWGCEQHIFALSILFERPFHIYTNHHEIAYNGFKEKQNQEPVSILLFNRHFTALLPVNFKLAENNRVTNQFCKFSI